MYVVISGDGERAPRIVHSLPLLYSIKDEDFIADEEKGTSVLVCIPAANRSLPEPVSKASFEPQCTLGCNTFCDALGALRAIDTS